MQQKRQYLIGKNIEKHQQVALRKKHNDNDLHAKLHRVEEKLSHKMN